jgi:hypothetical protein
VTLTHAEDQDAPTTGRAATREEIDAAALQFVRKVSGYRSPSQANRVAFDLAVAEVADASARLLGALRTR